MVFPDYYPEFKCIADSCRHNCCIGWEIDIDEDTLAKYQSIGGELGARLREHISLDDAPHFKLGKGGRCPFLNEKNLCELILSLGEDALCQICRDHPRFRNFLPNRVEIGVGLCCEQAARLILTKRETVRLINAEPTNDEIIQIRDEAILKLQNRNQSVPKRIEDMLTLCGAQMPQKTITQWADFLADLERLDESWSELLELLRSEINFDGFAEHMRERWTEYEQFLVYLTYRHVSNAVDEWELAARAAFVAFAYRIVYAIGAALWTKKGDFSINDQIDLIRQFSTELEYSDDNMDALFDAML